MEELLALSIPIVFVIVCGLITRWLSDNRVRRELIHSNASPELVARLLAAPEENSDSSLKWGIVAIAIGVALVVIHLMDLDVDDPVTFGLIFIGGGLGLLSFYLIKTARDSD